MMKKINWIILFIVIIVFVIGATTGLAFYLYNYLYKNINNHPNQFQNQNNNVITSVASIDHFSSEDDFKEYLSLSKSLSSSMSGYSGFGRGMNQSLMDSAAIAPTNSSMEKSIDVSTPQPERYSLTNVQIAGIDEPDIIKTDGQQIYFSQEPVYFGPYFDEPFLKSDVIGSDASDSKEIAPYYPQNESLTNIINALPVDKVDLKSKITRSGNLLLDKNILMIFSGSEIYGFDVSDPAKPQEKWKLVLDNNTSMVTARLYQNELFLVGQTTINQNKPCPMQILESDKEKLSIDCTDIYHPDTPIISDATYTIIKIDPNNGELKNKISFVGSYDNSVVYMSPKNIYLSYLQPQDFVKLFKKFLQENQDIFPSEINSKITRLDSYDISSNAKMVELQNIMEQHFLSLNEDEQLKLQNEIENRVKDYLTNHIRELEQTGLIKISVDNFSILANGQVPGRLLNQFSLDEYKNNLRVATTIEGNFWVYGFNGSSVESLNDLYVLDSDLKEKGSIKNLGKGERIYSSRFVNDKAYLVTFKQTDPFFVADLSDPSNPEIKGELKIPGYSSYLHPINDQLILGIGQESNKMKLSLFDVSDAKQPKEVSKYNLDEYWSDILNTHHAFMLDEKHNVFFLPGDKGGYIFSYVDNKLKLEKAVSDIQVKRALYINDYLYIIGEKNITILSEKDWSKAGELSLK